MGDDDVTVRLIRNSNPGWSEETAYIWPYYQNGPVQKDQDGDAGNDEGNTNGGDRRECG